MRLEVWQSHPQVQSQVLITAGVDGDEYAGINTAQTLIKTYRGTIPLTIIPLVNLPGYQAKVSWNPLDGKYPKHIFPGSPWGSSSSRLMYQVSKHTRGIKVWIDLHGPATGENLISFVWASQDKQALAHLSHLHARSVFENNPTVFITKKNICYLALESGEEKELEVWVKTIIENLDSPVRPGFKPTYTQVFYQKYTAQKADKDCLWYCDSEFVTAS